MRKGWLVLAAAAAVWSGAVDGAHGQEAQEPEQERFQRARIEGNRLVLRGEETPAPAAEAGGEAPAAQAPGAAAAVEAEQNAGAEAESNAGAEAEANAGVEAPEPDATPADEASAAADEEGAAARAAAGAGASPEEAAAAQREAAAEAEADARLVEREAAAQAAVDRAAEEEAAFEAAEEPPAIEQPVAAPDDAVAAEELAEEGDAALAAEAADEAAAADAEEEALAAEEALPAGEAPELATEIPVEGEEPVEQEEEELTPEERRALAAREAAAERARRMDELVGAVNQLGENQEVLDQRTADIEDEQEALRDTGVGIEEARLARIGAYEEAEARVRDLSDFLATGGGTGADAQMIDLALSLGELARNSYATSGEEEAQFALRAQEMVETGRASLAQGDLFNARMYLVGAADALLTARNLAQTTSEPLFRGGEEAGGGEAGAPGGY